MKRKNIIMVIVSVFVFVLPSTAQVRLGVKGGINITKVSLNKDLVATENLTGFHLGPMVEIMFPGIDLGVEAAALYSQKGMDFKKSSEKVSADFIDVPVSLKKKFGIGSLKIYALAGPYLSFRVGGDKSWKSSKKVEDIVSGLSGLEVDTKTVAAGINLGAGIEIIQHLQVGLQYSIGMTNDYKVALKDKKIYENAKNRVWSISAAFLF